MMKIKTPGSIQAVAFVSLLVNSAMFSQTIPANGTKVDTVMVELTPFGFSPPQISHAHGSFFLYVRNKSGPAPRSISLSMVTPSGHTVLKQKTLNQSGPHWLTVVNVGAGKYEVAESSHPTWTCTITAQ
jgi:hypothetical protein